MDELILMGIVEDDDGEWVADDTDVEDSDVLTAL